jgi:hypothetical protein
VCLTCALPTQVGMGGMNMLLQAISKLGWGCSYPYSLSFGKLLWNWPAAEWILFQIEISKLFSYESQSGQCWTRLWLSMPITAICQMHYVFAQAILIWINAIYIYKINMPFSGKEWEVSLTCTGHFESIQYFLRPVWMWNSIGCSQVS